MTIARKRKYFFNMVFRMVFVHSQGANLPPVDDRLMTV